jgi:hypothetical protein
MVAKKLSATALSQQSPLRVAEREEPGRIERAGRAA